MSFVRSKLTATIQEVCVDEIKEKIVKGIPNLKEGFLFTLWYSDGKKNNAGYGLKWIERRAPKGVLIRNKRINTF